ncbi:polysaccharide biosynthesis C-terminal domain-containing protein [Hathewaya histolytica]|uniref:Polysaccharide biosynthesis protein n=1 Tax=Hathewaya histolytica TaxID=1498 RepID=A0A4U9RUT6_HATHI|nr:polysaccharide biosynthesis C-terminal domain-containing protein [Hathewaya histolytica]VTQ92770.1 polysaccharide biosynthesis protein [Hathewaya histolytica]
MSNYKKNILNNFITNIFNMILAFFVSILISRKLGPGGKGYLSFFMLLADLIASYGHLGVINATNYFQTRKGFKKQTIYNINLTYNILICGIVTIVSGTLYVNDVIFKGYNIWVFIAFILYTIFILLRSFFNSIYIGDERIKAMNTFTVLPATISAIAVISMINHLTIFTYICIKVIEVGINVLLLLFNSKYKYRPYFSFNIIKDEIRYGINPLLANLSIYLNYKIDQFLIKFLNGNIELGLYTTAVMLSELVLVIPQAIANPITAKLYNLPLESKERKDTIVKTLRYGFTACVILTLIGMCCIPLIPIVYSDKYIPSQLITFILFLSIPFVSIGKITTPYFYSSGNVKIITRFSITSLVVNTVLNVLFIPKFRGIGAAMASSISYCVYGVQYIRYFRKELDIKVLDLLFISRDEFNQLIKSGINSFRRMR